MTDVDIEADEPDEQEGAGPAPRWSTPEIVSALLLLSVAVATLAVVAGSVMAGFRPLALNLRADGSEAPQPTFSISAAVQQLATYVDTSIILLLVTLAALWWQAGVLLDDDEADAASPSASVRLHRLLTVTAALVIVTAVRAPMVAVSVYLQGRDYGGLPDPLGQILPLIGILIAQLFACAAALFGERAIARDLSGASSRS